MYLGELLERLSREGRVPLELESDEDPFSGAQLVVLLRDRPLREVMRAVKQLLDHRYNRWDWRPPSRPGKPYTLRHTASAGAAAAAARADVLERWAADLRVQHEIGGLPEPERGRRARRRPDLFHPKGHDWDATTILGSLDGKQLDALLRGEQVVVDSAALPGAARAAFDRGHAKAVPLGEYTRGPLAAMYVGWDSQYVGPVVWLRIGHLARNAFGGLLWDAGWHDRLADGWRGDLDPEIRALNERLDRGDTSLGAYGPRANAPEWMERAARRQPLNVMLDGVFPHWNHHDSRPFIGNTPEFTVFSAVRKLYVTRRVGEVHLLRHTSTMVHPREHLLQWPAIRALRKAAEAAHGDLDLTWLSQLASLREAQWTGLAEEFSDVYAGELWGPVLRFYAGLRAEEREAVQKPEGLRVRAAPAAAKLALLGASKQQAEQRGLNLLLEHADAATVSLRIDETGAGREKRRHLVWEIRAAGTAGHRSSLQLQGRHPLKPESLDSPPPLPNDE